MPPKATTTASPATKEPTNAVVVDVEEYLKDASKSAMEPEVGDGPEGNWEVAYVYAFIDKFTDLRRVEYGSILRNVFDLEEALLSSSPPTKLHRRAALAASANNVNDGNGPSPASSLSSLSDDEDSSSTTPFVPMPSNPSISVIPPTLPADTPIPPPSDLLIAIIELFKRNLSTVPDLNDYHGRKSWLTWLINFVGRRITAPYRGGFRWESNLLRTRGLKPGQEEDKMFWLLRWEDKIHLFRQLVDFQLTSSIPIREMIKEKYDLGQQRNALRSPLTNPLIVDYLGTTLTKRQIYHIDESPRLYIASAIPAKDTQHVPPNSSSTWGVTSSTSKGYKSFLVNLPEAVASSKKGALTVGGGERTKKSSSNGVNGGGGGDDPFTIAAKAAADKAESQEAKATTSKRGPSSKGPKPGSKDDPKREERLIRAKLELGLPKLAKYEEAMAEIDVKERRVAARRAESDARVARNLSRMGTGTATRSSRSTMRQTSRVSYANDGIGENGDEVDELEEEDELASTGGGGDDGEMGRGKRRKMAAGNEDDWDASSVASGSTSGRRGGARGSLGGGGKSMPASIPGERRSRRVQTRMQEEGFEGGEEEVDELDEDGTQTPQVEPSTARTTTTEEKEENGMKVEESNGTKVEDQEDVEVPPVVDVPKDEIALKESKEEEDEKMIEA